MAPCGSCVVHICGCGAWVDGVGVDPAPGGMVARGVGNLYTWRSRCDVRELMFCRYEGTADRKKFLAKSLGRRKTTDNSCCDDDRVTADQRTKSYCVRNQEEERRTAGGSPPY